MTKNYASVFAKALFATLQGKSAEQKQKIIKQSIELLKRKQKIHLLPQILKQFEVCSKQEQITLTLSRDFDASEVDKIKNKITPIFGDKKILEVKTDANIIAGFTAQDNNYLIDASIKGLLNKLKTNN